MRDAAGDANGFPGRPDELAELFRAARSLLKGLANLDAVQVIHRRIERALSDASGLRVPARYLTLGEARRFHARLLAEWKRQVPRSGPVHPLRELRDRMPPWLPRAAVLAFAVLLTLRYVLRVTDNKFWAQQHPEGNWISRFYGNASFEGFPLVRYDVGVNVDFGAGAPADSMKKDEFSARWDTCLVVARDTAVPLKLTSDDSSRLYVDGQLQFEVAPGPGTKAFAVQLTPGLHQVRVDFVEQHGMAMVQLEGFEVDGAESYSFRRPVFEGDDLKCR